MSQFPSLRDRVVVITGGGRGLGREMALELAASGARLVVTGARAGGELADTVTEAAALSGDGRAIAVQADVRDPADCARVVAEAEAAFGAVDVLVNNAGRGMRLVSETFNTVPTKFWETDPAIWREIIDINLNGAFNMAAAVTPGMIARGFGKIINISTSDQTMVRRGYAPYGPSKAGLEAASRVWAQDLEGTGVDVMVYLPGGAADTALLPDSANKRGADGGLLPAAVMRRAIGWLCADESNGRSGARYIARLWDDSLPPDEAAGKAQSPSVDKPAIM
ncbi:MAG: 3-oxoacyl-[acyl-carrier protein] reductase [Rhodobacteraceae bacterium HLUCCA12]|nr:MAG: 3-oxoacyl-[acyl-carrier protein] reductase [Rhodobacteraceae bacterium HLUCCA12]